MYVFALIERAVCFVFRPVESVWLFIAMYWLLIMYLVMVVFYVKPAIFIGSEAWCMKDGGMEIFCKTERDLW